MKNFVLGILTCILIVFIAGCGVNSPTITGNQEVDIQKPTTDTDLQTMSDITTEINDDIVSIIGMNYLDVVQKYGEIKESSFGEGLCFMHENLNAWLYYDNTTNISPIEGKPTDQSKVQRIRCSASILITREQFSENDFDQSLFKYDLMAEVNIVSFNYKNVVIHIYPNDNGTIDGNSLAEVGTSLS